MTRVRCLYPAFFAAFPVVNLAARNPGYHRVADAALLCGVLVAGVALVYTTGYVTLRRRLPSERAADVAAVVAFGAVVLFYAKRPADAIGFAVARYPELAGLAAVALGGAAIWSYRRRWPQYRPGLRELGAFLTLFGGVLVAWSGAQMVGTVIRGRYALHRSALVRDLARPVPVRGAPVGPPRDVYLIVLDDYASSEVLRERFGFDNRPFEDSLRALGFRIPASYRNNYAVTVLSLPSLLNFAHMRPLAEAVGPRSTAFAPMTHLIDDNRAARFLRQRGYRYLFFPSTFFGPTVRSRQAHEEYEPYTGFDLGRAVNRSELAYEFVWMTTFRLVFPRLTPRRAVLAEHVARTFAGLRDVPRRPEPTFAVAHVLMPHEPYVVDSRCRPLPQGVPPSRTAQVDCVNRQVLETVRALLAAPGPQPIIVLSGDHGTASLLGEWPLSVTPTVAQSRERFRTFGAFYLPDGGAAALPDSLSVVNALRYVFGHYFGADLPPLPDRMYFSHWKLPYAMSEVGSDFRPVAEAEPRSQPGSASSP